MSQIRNTEYKNMFAFNFFWLLLVRDLEFQFQDIEFFFMNM
jgi:hypothetical protein